MLWIFKNKNIKQSNLYFLKKDFLILKKEKPYEKLNYSHFEKVYSKNKNRYFLVNFFLKKIKTKSEFYKKPKKKS